MIGVLECGWIEIPTYVFGHIHVVGEDLYVTRLERSEHVQERLVRRYIFTNLLTTFLRTTSKYLPSNGSSICALGLCLLQVPRPQHQTPLE